MPQSKPLRGAVVQSAPIYIHSNMGRGNNQHGQRMISTTKYKNEAKPTDDPQRGEELRPNKIKLKSQSCVDLSYIKQSSTSDFQTVSLERNKRHKNNVKNANILQNDFQRKQVFERQFLFSSCTIGSQILANMTTYEEDNTESYGWRSGHTFLGKIELICFYN